MRSILCLTALLVLGTGAMTAQRTETPSTLALPAPGLAPDVSLADALRARRSVREYSREPVTLEQVSQLLFAAQGVTDADGGRTAPSAGALYPLEIHVVAGRVTGLTAGVFRSRPREHELVAGVSGDVRGTLAAAALGQSCVADAPVVLVITGVYERTRRKYGDRAPRYVHMEAGHVAQNVLLQATALGLGAVVVGAFDDAGVAQALRLADEERPLALIPVGLPLHSARPDADR